MKRGKAIARALMLSLAPWRRFTNADFEWDVAKAAINAKNHRVTFEEAATAFDDSHAIDAPDRFIDGRFILIGRSARDRVLFVVHAVRSHDRIRIISARKASPAQRKAYENAR